MVHHYGASPAIALTFFTWLILPTYTILDLQYLSKSQILMETLESKLQSFSD